ncbi:MAG: LemA family protein [Verrucomicrobiota bacterium]
MHDFAPFLPLIGAMLALVSLACAFRNGRRLRLIANLPTSKTSGVFIGFVELKGTAESAGPLTSYLAEQSCVHYAWTVEEHWSRTVTTTETDSKGNTRTVTRHESGWTQVANGGETTPFYLQDDGGVILVQPEGSTIEPLKMFEETCTPLNPLYYGKGPAGAVANSDGRRRFVEMGIPLKAELYVVGQSRERQDIVAPEIAADEHAPMFLISTRSEDQVSRGMKWGARGWMIFGLLAAVGFTVWRDGTLNVNPQSRIGIYVAIAAGYFLIGLLAWVWMVFNSLVDVRQRVRAAWSLVDIQLKRRFDLIPNLVNCVKGYRDHEAQLQTELAALRNQLAATPPGVAGPDHGAVSNVIISLAERYPELKANESFLALQKTLSDTEQRIALARSYFNEIATHYNTQLEIVPERYVARLGAMKPQPLMAANDFERAAVTVDFTPKN